MEHWLRAGWLDYLAPQLYWPIDREAQAFAVLLTYWSSENWRGRHLWPGLFTSRIDDSEKSWQPEEIRQQIALQRSSGGASGHVHFSAAALVQNRKGIADVLAKTTYVGTAVVPPTPWLRPAAGQRPPAPRVELTCPSVTLASNDSAVFRVIVNTPDGDVAPVTNVATLWLRYGNVWQLQATAVGRDGASIPISRDGEKLNLVVARLVDRYGLEGAETVQSVPAAGLADRDTQ